MNVNDVGDWWQATLVKPHLADLERKIAPGMTTLTWASMGIVTANERRIHGEFTAN